MGLTKRKIPKMKMTEMKKTAIPKGKYTVLRYNVQKDIWAFVYDEKYGTNLLSYSTVDGAHCRIQELRRKHPKTLFMVGRNHEKCPNCRQNRPMKRMDFIGICFKCLSVIHQEMDVLYPITGYGRA